MIPHFANGEFPKLHGDLDLIRYAFEKLPQIKDPLEARIAMDTLFDLYLGLNTQENLKAHPMSSVRLHDAEKQTLDTGLEARIRLYAKAGINKHFSLTLGAFLRLPTTMLESVVRVSREMNQSEADNLNAERKRLEALQHQMGQSPPGQGTTGGQPKK